MNPSRADRFAHWILGRGLMALASVLLLAVMSASFLNVPWPTPPAECGGELCEIAVTDNPDSSAPTPTNQSLTKSLFGPYVILVVLIAFVLATCMIGGVYLAKMEGGGPPP